MAEYRPKVKSKILDQLLKEAGYKCANPGCANKRVQFHHILPWAVYKSHDSNHMIAVCPTCHDQIHNGSLQISDEIVYRWKEFVRTGDIKRGHLYIEPNGVSKVIFGSISFIAPTRPAVFYQNRNSYFRFDMREDDLMFINLKISTPKHKEIVRVTNNHLTLAMNSDLKYDERPGHIRITVPASSDYVPTWVLETLESFEPPLIVDNRLVLLSMEVIKPGLVQVFGVWPDKELTIASASHGFSFLMPHLPRGLTITGHGEHSVFSFESEPVDESSCCFGFRNAVILLSQPNS